MLYSKQIITLGIFALCLISHAYAQVEITVHPDHYASRIDDETQQQQEINTIPGNASLIDSSQWSNERAATIKDITDYIPGVIDQPRDGAESNRLSIRGSGLANQFQGEGILVLQDGIPINMADGEFEFPVIDPWLINYAEVFPGANALQYGASNFGGAINFITPTGVTGNGYNIGAEGGSFDTIHALLSDGRQWQGGDFFAAVTGFAQKGFRQQDLQDTGRFNANWGWQPNEDLSNRVYISHTHSDAQTPGAVSFKQVKTDPSGANPLNLANDYQRDLAITRFGDKSAWVQGDNRVDTTVFYTYRTLDNPVTTYEFQHNNDAGVQAKFTHHYGLSQWLIGANNYYGDATESRYKNDDATPGIPILNRNLKAVTSEFYGQIDQHLAGKFFGIAGMQEAYALRDISQTTPYQAAQNPHYFGFSPRVGLRYDLAPENQVFMNVSRSFDPPTWSDLSGGNSPGFNQLKAQYATTAEIGDRGVFSDIHWQASYYHAWLQNELVNYRFPSGATNTINALRTTHDGIELGLSGNLANNVWQKDDSISFRSAYTFSRFTLDHDPVFGNKTLPGVPEHYLRAETLYHDPSGISIGPNVEWSPTRAPVDLGNTVYSDSYAIYGARAFWESEDKHLNIYIEGRNLLDKNYAATYNVLPNASGKDGRYFYPGEGRGIYGGVRLSFN